MDEWVKKLARRPILFERTASVMRIQNSGFRQAVLRAPANSMRKPGGASNAHCGSVRFVPVGSLEAECLGWNASKVPELHAKALRTEKPNPGTRYALD